MSAGLCYRNAGLVDDAIAAFDRALDLEQRDWPSWKLARLGLVWCMNSKKQFAESMRECGAGLRAAAPADASAEDCDSAQAELWEATALLAKLHDLPALVGYAWRAARSLHPDFGLRRAFAAELEAWERANPEVTAIEPTGAHAHVVFIGGGRAFVAHPTDGLAPVDAHGLSLGQAVILREQTGGWVATPLSL